MAYTNTNFKTKKEFKQAVAEGKKIGIHSPGPWPVPDNGEVSIEGPHYPQPHRWYATATLVDGIVVKVK